MIKYIGLFIVSLLGFLVYLAPATILQDYAPEITLSGKVINGTAKHPTYGTISWQFNPSYLLSGHLAADVTLNDKGTELSGVAMVSVMGTPKLRDGAGVLELSYIKKFYTALPQFASTKIVITKLDADLLDQNMPLRNMLDANISFNDTAVMGEQIGAYNADLLLQGERLSIALNSTEDSAFKVAINATNEGSFVNAKGTISGNTPEATTLLQSLNIANDINYRYNLDTLQ